MKKIKVIVYGCGVMGRKTVEALLDKTSFEIVGAVDIDPALIGKDLGQMPFPILRRAILASSVRCTSNAIVMALYRPSSDFTVPFLSGEFRTLNAYGIGFFA